MAHVHVRTHSHMEHTFLQSSVPHGYSSIRCRTNEVNALRRRLKGIEII